MRAFPTGLTLAIAALGAMLGTVIGVPAALLTGSALAVSVAGLLGVAMDITPRLRDLAFLVVGIGIGSTVTPDALAEMLRLPMAFVALFCLLIVIMLACQAVLRFGFGFDPKTAVLAAAPGHLSFVIGLSLEEGVDTLRVTVVQAVRLLALTLIVPVIARLMGVEITGNPLAGSAMMTPLDLVVLLAGAGALGLIFLRWRMPAALLIAAMVVSSAAHAGGWVTGGIGPHLGAAAFVTLGALIGTRFSGIGWTSFRSGLSAGLAITVLASALSVVVALPLALALDLGRATTLAAFAPGGFETMIALGVVLGASPGFVAAAHVARLMMLTGLIPFMLGRARRNVPREDA